MSFFQRWIRPFFKRQEVTPPDSHENDSKTVEVKVKVEEESDSESVIFVRESLVFKDDANLRDNTNLEDTVYFQDDADFNLDSNPEDDANPQVDATPDDSAPSGLRSSPSTSQPLTPAPRSTSVSTDMMNVSLLAATSEVSANQITSKSTVLSINQLLFDQAQVADQPRLPWNWSHAGTKTREHYEPTAVGKWWWVWAQENRENLPLISNLGRIMETDLGEQRFGADRCTRCQREDLECWNYSQRAVLQVSNPGSACTRCRTEPRNTGCSLSRRTPKKRKTRPPTPPAPRLLLPKVGSGVYQYPPVHIEPGAPAVQAGNLIHTSK